jgi:uncharacterized protein with HEPN domain
MRRDRLKLLADIAEAADSIQDYTRHMTEDDYLANKAIRRAVEREFEIIGEALRRISLSHPDLAARFPQARDIVGFRNALAHGYDSVQDRRVWSTLTSDIPSLRAIVRRLAEEEAGA